MEIIDFNNEKFLVKRKHKIFQDDDLFNKIKFNTGSNVVLHKDNIFYFCQYINDAKIENNNDTEISSKVTLDNSCPS